MGSAVNMTVIAPFDIVLIHHVQNVIIVFRAVYGRIVEKYDRLQPCILSRPERCLQSARFSCKHLCIGRLAVVVYPASCAADTVFIICKMIVVQNFYAVKTVFFKDRGKINAMETMEQLEQSVDVLFAESF